MLNLRTDDATDAAGLSAFRVLFGAVLTFSVVRFWAMGWIESFYVTPTFHFSYPGFEWATTPSEPVVYGVFAAMFLAAVSLMVGFFPRVSAGAFAILFTYAEFWERATYLNHYYFLSLVALILALVPTAGYFSVRPDDAQRVVRRLNYTVLRGFVGLVYFCAGFAKLNADWMLRGEPLRTWLEPHAAVFTLGGAIDLDTTALLMSWGGAAFDLTIWAFLLWKPTRKAAFLVAVAFHTMVGLLFPIGVFPLVMVGAVTIFFEPDWPRRVFALKPSKADGRLPENRLAVAGVTLFLAVQAVLPLRSFLYEGNTNWNDDGFKWSWRVMLVERVGSVEYEVVTDRGSYRVNPRWELTEQQHKMLTVTPDMILEYAHLLGERYIDEGEPRVFARSKIAFNGRRSTTWIDPDRDLLEVGRWDFHDYVMPQPE